MGLAKNKTLYLEVAVKRVSPRTLESILQCKIVMSQPNRVRVPNISLGL